MCSPTARAQYSDSMGGSFNNPISSQLSSQIWGNMQMQMNLQMQRNLMLSAARRRNTGRSTAPGPGSVKAQTTFIPTGYAVIPARLAQELTRSEKDRAQLEVLFKECLKLYKEVTKKFGGSSGGQKNEDVAEALAYYVALNYYVYAQGDSSLASDVSPTQYVATIGTMRFCLSQLQQFQKMNDRQRQEIHETLAILGSLPLLGFIDGQNKNNIDQQEQSRELAKQNLGRLGLNPEQLVFTDNGLLVK